VKTEACIILGKDTDRLFKNHRLSTIHIMKQGEERK
jgi:hypothetical protein